MAWASSFNLSCLSKAPTASITSLPLKLSRVKWISKLDVYGGNHLTFGQVLLILNLLVSMLLSFYIRHWRSREFYYIMYGLCSKLVCLCELTFFLLTKEKTLAYYEVYPFALNYGFVTFYCTGPRCQCNKTSYDRNLLMFVVSSSICHWQSHPPWYNIRSKAGAYQSGAPSVTQLK
jgi:hypothetical protein